MSITLPFALFYGVLLALALWGAWVGWTRSKSPTARAFVTVLALVWAGFTAADGWSSYRIFRESGVAGLTQGNADGPVEGSYSSCSFCYEGPAGMVYVVAASEMEGGGYTFKRDAHYALRFKAGDVRWDGKPLEPGCREGEARAGTRVLVKQAQGFRLEVGEAASCR